MIDTLAMVDDLAMTGAVEYDVPDWVTFFSAIGCMSATVFTAIGAAYGTAKSGIGITAMAIMKPDMIWKSIVPVVMAGIIAIYGIVVAILRKKPVTFSLFGGTFP